MDGVPRENITQLCLGKPTEEEPVFRDLPEVEFIDIDDYMYMRNLLDFPDGFPAVDRQAFNSGANSPQTHENQEDNETVIVVD